MQKKMVVYVEKEKFLRELMEKATSGAGFDIYSYPDHDCMHFIDDLKPDLLILDGQTISKEFIERLDAHIPVILTGDLPALESLSRPIHTHIEKPLGPFDLVAIVSKILQQ